MSKKREIEGPLSKYIVKKNKTEHDDQVASSVGKQMPNKISVKLADRLTEEQKAIVLCNGERIFVQAYAGTGKTSTLEEYCRVRPKERFLYIAFNKTVQQEASRKFGKNVECRTIDSICMEIVGGSKGKMEGLSIALIRKVCPDLYKKGYLAKSVLGMIKTFIESAKLKTIKECRNPEKDDGAIYYAEEFWEKATSKDATWFCHAINRKIAVMMNDGIAAKEFFESRYDTILLDECQDINTIMYFIVESFDGKKIFIGDMHQAIYSFMGCVNAFKLGNPTHKLTLSKSFRFGNKIADRADWIISKLKNFPNRTPPVPTGIKGMGDNATSIEDTEFEGKKHTILARVNKTLFRKAHDCSLTNQSINWLGKDEFFGKIQTFLEYYRDDSVWGQKREQAELDEDIETLSMMDMIEHEGETKLVQMMDKIQKASQNERQARVILSTVHKAKGLEWDNVRVCDDIGYYLAKTQTSYQGNEELKDDYEEECNIYYVSITRAKKCLCDEAYAKYAHVLDKSIPPPNNILIVDDSHVTKKNNTMCTDPDCKEDECSCPSEEEDENDDDEEE